MLAVEVRSPNLSRDDREEAHALRPANSSSECGSVFVKSDGVPVKIGLTKSDLNIRWEGRLSYSVPFGSYTPFAINGLPLQDLLGELRSAEHESYIGWKHSGHVLYCFQQHYSSHLLEVRAEDFDAGRWPVFVAASA